MTLRENRRNQFFVLFLGTWLILYLVWPRWYLPVSIGLNAIILASYIVYFAITGWFLWLVLERQAYQDSWSFAIQVPSSVWRAHRSLVLLFGLVFVLHLVFALMIPELYYASDESYHAVLARTLIEKADKIVEKIVAIPFLWIWRAFVFGSIVTIAFFWRRVRHFWQESCYRLLRPRVAIALGLALAGWGALLLVSGIPVTIDLFVFPQLGRLLYLVSYTFFGKSIVSGRLVQIAFGLAAGVLVYHLTRLYWDRRTAALACGIYLLLPNSFYYGQTGEYASGTLFFLILIGYYFLRYEKTQRPEDLLMAVYFVGLGYNYKRVIVNTLFVFWLYWIFSSFHNPPRESIQRLWEKVLYTCLALVPILPAYFTDMIFSERISGFRVQRLLDLNDLTLMFRALPREASLLVLVLFLGGVAWCLWRHRNAWTGYLLLWFAVFYLFFTIWYNLTNPRYLFYFVPPVAMFGAVALGRMLDRLRSKAAAGGVVGVVIVYLIYSSVPWGWPPRERPRFERTVGAEERLWERQLVDRTFERVRRVWKGDPLKPKTRDGN